MLIFLDQSEAFGVAGATMASSVGQSEEIGAEQVPRPVTSELCRCILYSIFLRGNVISGL